MTSQKPDWTPILFSREDAAIYLGGISVRKLDELQAQRRIVPRALDGRRVYLRDELEEFARGLPGWPVRP